MSWERRITHQYYSHEEFLERLEYSLYLLEETMKRYRKVYYDMYMGIYMLDKYLPNNDDKCFYNLNYMADLIGAVSQTSLDSDGMSKDLQVFCKMFTIIKPIFDYDYIPCSDQNHLIGQQTIIDYTFTYQHFIEKTLAVVSKYDSVLSLFETHFNDIEAPFQDALHSGFDREFLNKIKRCRNEQICRLDKLSEFHQEIMASLRFYIPKSDHCIYEQVEPDSLDSYESDLREGYDVKIPWAGGYYLRTSEDD